MVDVAEQSLRWAWEGGVGDDKTHEGKRLEGLMGLTRMFSSLFYIQLGLGKH